MDTGPPRIHLWEGHRSTYEVYRACQWRLLPIPHGSSIRWRHMGIEAVEIEAAARLLQVPRRDRPAVFRNVLTMAAAAAPILNGDA